MNKYLLTTVCDNGYALGAQVMIYSISKNLKNFDQCDIKVYYNDNIAPLSEKNKNIFRAIGKNIILEHVDETKYIDAKVPYHQGREEGSKAAYLTLESFNETNYDKVIMFDVDMLCIKDFSELFTSDYELGIFNRNTGFVVLGKSVRTPEVYNSLISNIKGHNGDFMDQGLIGKILGRLFEPLPSIYNEYKPIWAFNENTRILHWAHFDYIKPLLDHGHIHFGENKVQEAIEKWTDIKSENKDISLHLIGKLQSNKTKLALKIFDYIHSVDSEKLARKIAEEQSKINKKIKIFLQVNIGEENQKSGINKNEVGQLISFSKEIGLNVIGLMCIPPVDTDPEFYFEEMKKLNQDLGFTELSMGMSSDFLSASKYSATYVRIGSNIFGQRS